MNDGGKHAENTTYKHEGNFAGPKNIQADWVIHTGVELVDSIMQTTHFLLRAIGIR